ncbi:hypothetical protein [Actinomadura rupiterrae]|uniref:hypothetical protein n=1 Tax=Actinomadura rupiterrae TaxID=559627 RepID=UPI0020A59233|nr:hypothetical protein [Actinomadura rupiterrae]MCP2337584.1 hypothetical protein [Actinomadura rupiterrae]
MLEGIPDPGRVHVRLRLDGLYAQQGETYTSFLRFFPTGEGMAVSVEHELPLEETVLSVAAWLLPSHPSASRGPYSVEGNVLSFEATSEAGLVEFLGVIAPHGMELCLHSHSHINGHRAYRVYRYHPLPASSHHQRDNAPGQARSNVPPRRNQDPSRSGPSAAQRE